jgi:aquaporin Z
VAQCRFAVVAAAVPDLIVSGKSDFAGLGGFASNDNGAASQGGFGLTAAFVTEVAMTAGFLIVILGATAHRRALRPSRSVWR